jgi:hypothetical protein
MSLERKERKRKRKQVRHFGEKKQPPAPFVEEKCL